MPIGESFGLPFPREEYDERLSAVRRGMAVAGVEVLLLFAPANIAYITGYNTVGYTNYQCLAVPMAGPPVLVVRLLEQAVARATTWLETIVTYADHEDPAVAVRRALHDAGLGGRRLAVEQTSPLFSVRSYTHLAEVLGAPLADGSGLVEAVRVTKSPREIACLRSAARCTEAGMRAALDAIAEQRTENEVAAECYRAMVAAGSEFLSGQPILTSGHKSGIAHTTFHRRTLQRGDAVLIEIGGVWNRYTAPLMRTATVGAPPSQVRRMYDVCREAL